MPLIAAASGTMMGKTAAGAVWLSADQVLPFDWWQSITESALTCERSKLSADRKHCVVVKLGKH